MSFKTHTIVAALAAGTGISVSLFKTRPKSKATLLFSLRPKVVQQLGWKDGDRISVQLGEDEHHGLVRLRKDKEGTATLKERHAGGRGVRGGPYFRLGLGVVDLFVDRSEPKRWVTFDTVEDGWLEIALPTWADETGPRKREEKLPKVAQPLLVQRVVWDVAPAAMGDPPPGRSALAQRRGGK